jgi:hypothetical protein
MNHFQPVLARFRERNRGKDFERLHYIGGAAW